MRNILSRAIEHSINTYYKYFYIQWHLISDCTEKCKHCYLYKDKDKNVFNLENSKEIVDKIYDVSKKRGVPAFIGFTGGDPLLFKGIYELIEYASEKGIGVTIKGNPRLLTDESIKKLKAAGVRQYNLSIEGLKENHDFIRSKGSYDITLEKIKMLKDNGIATLVKYTVSKLNAEDMKESMLKLAKIGVDCFDFARFCPNSAEDYKYMFTPKEYRSLLIEMLQGYQDLIVEGYDFELLLRDHLWMPLLDELGILESFKDVLMDTSKMHYGCSMGNNNCFVINYDGYAYPCAKLKDYCLGNVFEDGIEGILKGEKAKALSEISSYEGCESCSLVTVCRGCPALSNSIKKNMFAKDPQCWREEHE